MKQSRQKKNSIHNKRKWEKAIKKLNLDQHPTCPLQGNRSSDKLSGIQVKAITNHWELVMI
jgi:hypothetical protein